MQVVNPSIFCIVCNFSAILFSIICFLTPGHVTLIHYICTGLNPGNYSGIEREKKLWRNLVLYIVGVISCLLHVFIWVRIGMYKRKCHQDQLLLKETFLFTLEKKSITGILTGLFYILFICLILTLLYLLNSMNYTSTYIFPNNILIYFYHFGLLNMICLCTTFIFYMRHDAMRAGMIREVKEHLNVFGCK